MNLNVIREVFRKFPNIEEEKIAQRKSASESSRNKKENTLAVLQSEVHLTLFGLKGSERGPIFCLKVDLMWTYYIPLRGLFTKNKYRSYLIFFYNNCSHRTYYYVTAGDILSLLG